MILAVCGAGTMGSGIAFTATQNGISTILFDLKEDAISNARHHIESILKSQLQKSRISATESKEILERIQFTTNVNDCIADVIIEAVIERIEIKTSLFNQLALINNNSTVFATNTSSLSVNKIAESLQVPDRLIGMHFFNPPQLMKLVEVVVTSHTSELTVQTILQLARVMKKIPVTCKDAPGFIVNHVARPFYLEALYLFESGSIDVETIDVLMESCGFKMGPFKLMDLIGNDINYTVSCSVYEAMGKPARLEPSRLQAIKVVSGELGKKSGKGYYNYH